MSESQQTGMQIVNGEEVIVLKSKKPRKPRASSEEKLEKKKRVHVWTDKTRAAFEKCRAVRLANIEKKKQSKPSEPQKEKEIISEPVPEQPSALPSGFQPVQ